MSKHNRFVGSLSSSLLPPRRVVASLASCGVVAAVLGVGVLARGAFQEPNAEPPPILVATAEEAYLVGAPEFVCGAGMNSVKPSPGGRYALISRMRPIFPNGASMPTGTDLNQEKVTNVEMSLLLWDSRRATTRAIWRGQMSEATGGTAPANFAWLGKSNRAIVAMNSMTPNPRANQPAPPNEPQGDTMSRQMPRITSRFFLFNAATGSLAPIANMPAVNGEALAMMGFQTAPNAPFAVADTTDYGMGASGILLQDKLGNPNFVTKLAILGADGSVRTLTLPPGSSWIYPNWSKEDAERMYVWQSTVLTREKVEGQKYDKTTREQIWHSVNLKTGVMTKLAEKPKDRFIRQSDDEATAASLEGALANIALLPTIVTVNEPTPATAPTIPAVSIPLTATTATTGTKPASPKPGANAKPDAPARREISLLYLHGKAAPPEDADKSRVLLAADARPIVLLPDASAALYSVRGGSLFAVPLTKVNRAEMLAMRRAAEKATTMSNARQIGLGLLMYAQDYDEVFPHDPAGIPTIVQPYLKNDKVFHNPSTGRMGFTYLLLGGATIAKLDKPAQTQMGTVQGPGGRAIIFADGHVVWEDDVVPPSRP